MPNLGIYAGGVAILATFEIMGCKGADGVTAMRMSGTRMADLDPTEWSAPVNLGPSINTASSEVQLGIAPNGKSLYVMSNRAGGSGDADIWVSSRQPDGSWGPLVNVGATVNSSALDASPTLSIDGHYLYFASRRPGGLGGLDCWRSHRADPSDDFAWETPENLGQSVNSAFDDADCLPVGNQNANGEFWFTSLNRPAGKGGYDIYKSDIGPDGSFGAAAPVPELNTAGRETRLTLTGNGLTIYFTSNREGGLGGIDVWTASRKTKNSPFCAPVNLGSSINSSADDRSPSITTNGKELYFTSTRPGGLGSDDAYVAERAGGPSHLNCDL
jgi:Tol biopolymer transport system component